MKTILVPTDFSKLSKVAVSYAIGLAKKIEAKVIVLSVVSGAASSRALLDWKKFEESMVKTAKHDAEQLMGEIKSEKGKIDVWYQQVLGFPVVDKIEEFASKNKADLIVMGSKGATGLKKIIMGSNASAVINNSSVPVIVVPGEVKFKPIKKLVYATDARNFEKEVKTASKFAAAFGASLEVLHVMPVKTDEEQDMTPAEKKHTREKLIAMARYPKIHLHIVRNNNVAKGVEDFVTSAHVDLLTMFTHRLGFNEKLFDASVTRRLALHNQVPLLAFNKSNGAKKL